MKKILVHICCGPCSIYPIKSVLSEDVEVVGYFFNPNIQPLDEFERRLASVKKLSELMEIDVIYTEAKSSELFVRDFEGRALKSLEKEDRCHYCYALRLEATARAAAENGFDAFTSSLLYSRYQDHELMRRLGAGASTTYGPAFFYHDFREGWREGIEASKEMGLYRQKYCGCIYSWMERYKIEPGLKKAADVSAEKAG